MASWGLDFVLPRGWASAGRVCAKRMRWIPHGLFALGAACWPPLIKRYTYALFHVFESQKYFPVQRNMASAQPLSRVDINGFSKAVVHHQLAHQPWVSALAGMPLSTFALCTPSYWNIVHSSLIILTLGRTLARLAAFARKHPTLFKVQVVAVVGTVVSLAIVPILGAVGFSAVGPVAGTAAAAWQASMGLVEAGSLFAWCQSVAMGGAALGGITAFGIGSAAVAIGAGVASEAVKKVAAVVNEVGPHLARAANEVGGHAVNVANKVGPQVVTVVNEVGGHVAKAANEVGGHAINVANEVGPHLAKAANEVGRHVVHVANEVGPHLAKAANEVGGHVVNVASDVGPHLARTANELGERVWSLWRW